MNLHLSIILTVLVSNALTQEIPIQRRQLTQTQQNHILTDIQLHQHRFNFHQNQPRSSNDERLQVPVQQQQNPFAPNQPIINPNSRFQQFPNHPNAPHQVPNIPPQFLQNSRQSQFQRSAQNHLGQASFNHPVQYNQFNTKPLINSVAPLDQLRTFQTPTASHLIQPPPQLSVQPQQNFNQNRFQPQPSFFPQQEVLPEPNRLLSSPTTSQFQLEHQPQNLFLPTNQQLPQEQRANVFQDTRTEDQRRNEQQLRQKLIEKQEKYAQKFYQKEQQRVKKIHEDYLESQRLIQDQAQEKLRPQQSQLIHSELVRHQGVQPTDYSAFEKSVKQYYQQNPTTPVPKATVGTTIAADTQDSLTVVPLKKNKNKSEVKTLNSDDIQKLLRGNNQNLFSQIKQESLVSQKSKPAGLDREMLLQQIQQLGLNNEDFGDKNYTSKDITLPSGEKVQIIRTTDPDLISKAQAGKINLVSKSDPIPSPLVSVQELAKSEILPPGANFEVVKQSESGLQTVQKVPQQKKVTFVYLEEQDDGSYKVQGVKSNNDKEAKRSGTEVDNILKRIENGEIKLPAAEKKAPRATATPSTVTSFPKATKKANLSSGDESFKKSTASIRTSSRGESPVFQYSFTATTNKPSTEYISSIYSTLPTFAATERNPISSVTPRVQRLTATTGFDDFSRTSPLGFENHQSASSNREKTSLNPAHISSYSPTFSTTASTTFKTSTVSPAADLADILKKSGLFAMAKYLKQSGLDSILNETGPYTIFAPTDKAFKNLLVQLGGPERAEEKFKNNPRLLSGLLLHHVIPGSFRVDELQDEMTGVSLAGTQLRVNQYQMQDTEWNDVKITTINGASVNNDNNDIIIPQGIGHSIDRVMFPLPVGDILQTLQSDREKRFTHFLRAIFSSNMANTLQNKGINTYTIFAPTDLSFSHLTPEELNTLVNEKDSALELVQRHTLQGTLFTSGMRFYQVKDTLAEEKTITVQKNGGKVKVNESTIVTSNIPATNGVIHAIDTLL